MRRASMKYGFGVLVLSLVIAIGWAIPASATTTSVIQFNSVASNPGVYGGFYAGIYLGTVNGRATQFVCDDFRNEIGYGQSWYAYDNTNSPNVSTGPTGVRYLGAGGGLYNIGNPDLSVGAHTVVISAGLHAGTYSYTVPSNGPINGLTKQQEYNMIAWLVGQIFNDQTNSQGNWGSKGGAIWSIADGAWNNSSYTSEIGTETAQYWVIQALSHDGSSSPYHIYTPFNNAGYCGGSNQPSCNGQEFWSAPEAGTPWLLSLTLLGGGLLGKRVFGESRV